MWALTSGTVIFSPFFTNFFRSHFCKNIFLELFPTRNPPYSLIHVRHDAFRLSERVRCPINQTVFHFLSWIFKIFKFLPPFYCFYIFYIIEFLCFFHNFDKNVFKWILKICFSDDHDDNDDPSLGEDSGGGDGDGTDFHQLFINFNMHIIL